MVLVCFLAPLIGMTYAQNQILGEVHFIPATKVEKSSQPADSFAANFLGRTNLLPGSVEPNGRVSTRWGMVDCPLPTWAEPGTALTIGFRPEATSFEVAHQRLEHIHGTVLATSFSGDTVEYQVDLGQNVVRIKAQPFNQLRMASKCSYAFRPSAATSWGR